MSREAIVPFYFHLGGMAGGLYCLGALLLVFGAEGERLLAHRALMASPVLTAVCGGMLVGHLTVPTRFWRVLTRFKFYSPISVGAWGLSALGLAGAWSFVALCPGFGGVALPLEVVALGALSGWFVAAYTGVLLTASSRPLWSSTSLLGGVFCVTGLATSAAFLRLVMLAPGPPGLAALAPKVERVATALLLMSAALWVLFERALTLHAADGETLADQLRAPPFGLWFWLGLGLGMVLPAMMLAEGGAAAVLGALLAASLSIGPRAAVVFAGHGPAPGLPPAAPDRRLQR